MPTEAENMEAHSLMLELCHQLGAKDGESMVEMLFDAVRDTRRYRWLRAGENVFRTLGCATVVGEALDRACDRGLQNAAPQNAPTSERGSEADASDSYPAVAALETCPICNGARVYCVGTSGHESDGNAPILEQCECVYDRAAIDGKATK